MLARLLLAVALLSQTSCTMLSYVTQAAAGQDDLTRRARDIDELVREKHVGPRMRGLLSQVSTIKEFGERHGLRPTRNYTTYVHIDRPAVVWAVSASEPLRFKSKTWSFPFVGSFTFLNWFKRADADAFAKDLKTEGWDVDVREVGAYSTAGYFDDPVLSTMIPDGKRALGYFANTIVHESAHATILIKHQSPLNESIANFFGKHLGATYLVETRGADAEETLAYLESERTSEERGRAMQAAYLALERLYASPAPDAQKLEEKHVLVAALQKRIGARRTINNAMLIQFKTYNSGQRELGSLLDACGGDWPRLVRALKLLESSTFAKPHDTDIGPMISPLIDRHCPG